MDAAERLKAKAKPLFATHDGSFHADDAAAYAVLSDLFPRHRLERTRDEAVLAEADLAFDVGGGPYDHHGLVKPLRPDEEPYSSAGLVWRDFGLAWTAKALHGPVDSDLIVRVHARMDKSFFSEIDAVDNGTRPPGPLSLIQDVDALNPRWDEIRRDPPPDRAARFVEAASLLRAALLREAARCRSVELGLESARKALSASKDPRLAEMPCPGLPWEDAVFESPRKTLLVLHPDSSGGKWVVVCVPDAPGSFGQRLPLPEAWAGLRGSDLETASGVEGAVFCHASRFMAVAKSREGALALAQAALQRAPAEKAVRGSARS